MLIIPKRTGHAILIAFFLAIFLAGAIEVAAEEKAVSAGSSVAGHIPRPASDTPHPVSVITRRDIELSGAQNVRDLLLSRLDFNSFGLYRPFVAGGGRRVILVNGRRVSYSGFDAEAFPLSAVERIEILSDSAAALHGGHAIGGAINIVLRRDFKGVEVQAGAARPRQAGADSEQGSFVWGGALGRGRAVIGLDVVRREEIRDADRDYSRGSWTPGGPFADSREISVGGNTAFITPPGGSTLARPLGDCEGSSYVAGLTDPIGHPGVGCGFDYTAVKWHDDWYRLAREGLFLSAEHPLGESADIYLDARFAQSESKSLYAPSVGTFRFSPPQLLRDKLLQYPEIDALPDEISVAHRFVAHGNREWVTDIDERDLTLGVRGRLGEVGYDAHFRYYMYDLTVNGNTFVSGSAIARAIGDGRYNVENPFSTEPNHLAAIRETSLALKREQVAEYTAARAAFNGKAFPLPAGSVLWAAGAEIASQDWKNIHDYRDADHRSYPASDVLGSGGSSSEGDRRTVSAFAEASLPLLRDWDVTLAGRNDDHDDVGATFSGQVASRYRLNKNLALRASWGTGGRPPALSTLHLRESVGYPNVCDVSTHTGDIADCDKTQVERLSSGNPDLEPDEAESLSIGAAASVGPFSVKSGLVPNQHFQSACGTGCADHPGPRGERAVAPRSTGDPRWKPHPTDRGIVGQQWGKRHRRGRPARAPRLEDRPGGDGFRPALVARDRGRNPGGRREVSIYLPARPRSRVVSCEPGPRGRELERVRGFGVLEYGQDRPLRRMGGPRRHAELARGVRYARAGAHRRGVEHRRSRALHSR